MQRSILCRTAVLALGAALLGAACAPDQSVPTAASEESSVMLAHSPAQHGVSRPAGPTTALSDYAHLDAAAADGDQASLRLSIDAAGAIPRFPDEFIESVAVFGYAWVDGDTGAGVVAVIHPLIGRDSRQNPDAWHTHPVQLTAPGAFSFCIVSIGTSQGGISIQEGRLRVSMARKQAEISATALDVAAAFVVRPDAACASGLGVEVLTALGL